MATYHLNEDFGLTLSCDQAGKAKFVVTGTVFSRKTNKPVGVTVQAEGRTKSSADQAAIEKARHLLPKRRKA